MIKIKSNLKGGFTLIEVLIVISILIILMSITILSYGNIFTKAEYQMDINNAKLIRAEVNNYYIKNGYWPKDKEEFLSDINIVGKNFTLNSDESTIYIYEEGVIVLKNHENILWTSKEDFKDTGFYLFKIKNN